MTNQNDADKIYGDGEVPEDADLNAPAASKSDSRGEGTDDDEAVEDVAAAIPGDESDDTDTRPHQSAPLP